MESHSGLSSRCSSPIITRMKNPSIDLIRNLTQTTGLSGYESAIGEIVTSELSSLAQIERDRVGNVLCKFPGSNPAGPHILIAAHQDEVGFIVSDILDNGFLRIHNIGGWNTITLPSSPVSVLNAEGEALPGIIGQISPHFLKKSAPVQVPELEDLFVDIGAGSAQEVKDVFLVELGALVVPVSPFHVIERSGCVMSKAFDDRIGIAALIEVGKIIANSLHTATITLAATVQEEVGTRGARVLANYTDADIVLVVEGAPADDMPGGPSHPQTCVGRGAHLRIFDPTHIGHPGLIKHLRGIARMDNIRIQEAVRKGGGTDAVMLALADRGIPSVVMGVPVRYAHSHNCLMSLSDYKNLIDLLVSVCLKTDDLGSILG
jgi:putative aminopeptidase FrvX